MQKRRLGNTGYLVSPVVYGGIVSDRDGQQNSDRYVSWAIDRGINYFDVAPTYGDAQEKLGNSLKPYRKNVYLACKTLCRTYAEAEEKLHESLNLLHTDYFDLYQMHMLTTDEDIETAFGKGGIMELMEKAQRDGIVRKLGITCHSEKSALRAMELYDFDTILFPMNWHMSLAHGMGTKACEEAKKRGIGILAMKELIERCWISFDEKENSPYPKSWCKPIDMDNVSLRVAAMKYALAMGADTLIPPGDFENFKFAVEHIEECLDNPLDQDDLALLEAALEKVRNHPFFDEAGRIGAMVFPFPKKQ